MVTRSLPQVRALVVGVLTIDALIGGARAASRSVGPEALLRQAVETYQAAMDSRDRDERLQEFARAEQLFRQVIQQHEEEGRLLQNAEIQVNLGNAALQAEHLGPAIVAYRRALLLDPAHAQARQNLQHARANLPETWRPESTSQLIDTLFFWRSMYSRGQILAVASLCFLLAAVLLALSLARRQPVWRNLATLPLVAWLVLLASLIGGDGSALAEAVVVTPDLVVYSADSENSAPRFSTPLPSGVEVRILAERGRWTEIEISPGRGGWVRASGLERVALERVALGG